MDLDNYTKQERTITATEAYLKSLIFIAPIVLLFATPFYLIWGNPMQSLYDISPSVILRAIICMSIYIAGLVLHELIHGITWAKYSKHGMKSIKFGILKPSMIPYCHCKEILKAKHYRIGVVMPALITGFFPTILSIVIGSPLLLIFGIVFVIGAGGDFMILWMLRKDKNLMISDHPSKIGYIVYKEV